MLLIIWEEKESFQLLSDIEGQMVGGTTHILDTVSSPDNDLGEDLIAILLDVLAAPSVQFPDNGSVWSEERPRRMIYSLACWSSDLHSQPSSPHRLSTR